MKIEWKCPACGAHAGKHGKGGKDKCEDRHATDGSPCQGFICECVSEEDDHGETFTTVCPDANCYHCGWAGSFPVKPKKLAPWEKKALEAGWAPPTRRAKELGLSTTSEGSVES